MIKEIFGLPGQSKLYSFSAAFLFCSGVNTCTEGRKREVER